MDTTNQDRRDTGMVIVYERLRLVPQVVRSFCFACDGLVVGGGAKFLIGDIESARDWDVIIPPHRWMDAAWFFPYKSETNTFGGVKIACDGFSVDVWADDLGKYFATIGGGFDPVAVNIRTQQVIISSKR